MPVFDFAGCTVEVCSRRMDGRKKRSNYQIEETCRYSQMNQCPYKKEQSEDAESIKEG